MMKFAMMTFGLTSASLRGALAVGAVTLLLGACASKPKTVPDTPAASQGQSTTTQPQAQDSGTGAPLDTMNSNANSNPSKGMGDPGSQEDLIATVGSDKVFFDYNGDTLDSDSQEKLKAQAAWLSKYPAVRVNIEGHCDERGTREYNLALGDRRAEAVRSYLTSLGISGDRINTVSYGKERPDAVGSDEESWARNRRAVTVVRAN
jgi:peptidoglycan-associated lipoprotein